MKSLPINILDEREVLGDALKLALKHSLTIYDSLLVARREGAIPITSDRRQAEAARSEGVEVLLI